jgi:hypothetical protein
VKLGSTLSPKFFDTYRHLPPGIRAKARENYRLFVADPASVKFKAIKRLADGKQLCSARVTRDCRVLGSGHTITTSASSESCDKEKLKDNEMNIWTFSLNGLLFTIVADKQKMRSSE